VRDKWKWSVIGIENWRWIHRGIHPIVHSWVLEVISSSRARDWFLTVISMFPLICILEIRLRHDAEYANRRYPGFADARYPFVANRSYIKAICSNGRSLEREIETWRRYGMIPVAAPNPFFPLVKTYPVRPIRFIVISLMSKITLRYVFDTDILPKLSTNRSPSNNTVVGYKKKHCSKTISSLKNESKCAKCAKILIGDLHWILLCYFCKGSRLKLTEEAPCNR
jgi:hypothetical protein